jgi:argininosuccinate lyase
MSKKLAQTLRAIVLHEDMLQQHRRGVLTNDECDAVQQELDSLKQEFQETIYEKIKLIDVHKVDAVLTFIEFLSEVGNGE